MWTRILVALLLAYNARADLSDEEDACSKLTSQETCEAEDDCSWSGNACVYDEGKGSERTLMFFNSHMPQQVGPPQHGPHMNIDGNTCRKFPYTCRPDKYNIKSIEPPVNIPYCQRIPCPIADQSARAKAQGSQGACMQQPGCFFDKELSYYRRAYGNSVLPDVPVCHLVIRNQVFLEHARKYAAQYNGWNPLLTTCLIETYHDEIYGDTPGCYIANILDYFGYRPRIAGWKGINKYECHAIDGCWMPSGSCAYPVEGKSAEFRPFEAKQAPEQPRTISTDPYDVYNRVACHRFRNLYKHDDFLDTYHQCMSSGCLIDPYIQNYYSSHMYNLTMTLPSHTQSLFWQAVLKNEIRADNYREMYLRYMTHYEQKSQYGRQPYTPNFHPFSPYLTTSNPYQTSTNPYDQYMTGATPYTIPDFTFGSQQGYYGQQGSYGYTPSGGYGYGGYGSYYNPYSSYVRCPYQPIKLRNFPPLKGSFKGCCERSMCYAPSGHVHASILTSYYTHWSQWSACNATCGGGVQSRTRTCVGQLDYTCEGKTEEQACNVEECPIWGEWGEFGECSVTCGAGLKTRTRSCARGRCYGQAVESERCDTGVACPAPTYHQQPYTFGQQQGGFQYYPSPQGGAYPPQGGAYPPQGGSFNPYNPYLG